MQQPPFVEGEVHLAERQIPTSGQWLVVRAVPDHPDGFDPRRGYHGDEEFIETVPITSIDFPYTFYIPGGRPRAPDESWLLLAFVTDNPHAEWLQPGQLYGATPFELVHTPHGPSYADDLVVTLDAIGPPPPPAP